MQQNENQMTPQQHAQHIAQVIQQAVQECQADLQRVSEPKAQVVFEGVVEILDRAIKVLNDYSSGKEPVLYAPSYERRPLAEETEQKAPPTVTEFAVDVDSSEPPPRLHTEIPKE